MYSPFHKTLPKSSLQMHWISVRFYEMGDPFSWIPLYYRIKGYNKLSFKVIRLHIMRNIVVKDEKELFEALEISKIKRQP